MKFTKISLAALVALTSTTVFAASDLEGAFKEGKVDGRLRAHYFYTDWDRNGDFKQIDSQGLAVGGTLAYKTASLYGVSAGAAFYTTQNPAAITENNTNAKNSTAADLFFRSVPANTGDFSRGYSVLGQAYLQYDISKTQIKAGRMLMSNPFISPNDTKMIPIAVQAASVESKDLPDTVLTASHVTDVKERGRDTFNNMADTGDTPDAIKNHYHTSYTGTTAGFGTNNVAAVTIAGAKNKSIKDLELQGWVLSWPDIVNQIMLEANYGIKAGGAGLSFGARYMQQFDQGAGDIIKPKDGSTYSAASVKKKGDSDNSVATNLYALRAIASYAGGKFLLSYAKTDKGGDMLAPWRAFPTDGYTRSMTQTDWNANTKSYKAQLDYDFSSFVNGFSALVGYSFYDRDPSKVPYQSMTGRYYGNGDTRQVNFDMMYKPAFVKNTEFKIRSMIQHNDKVANAAGNTAGTAAQGIGADTSNKELRIELNYFF